MIDLARLQPVIDEHCDSAVLDALPSGVHVVFAGRDTPFLNALRRIYRLLLPDPDLLVCSKDKCLSIMVGATDNCDGLCLHITYPNDEPGPLVVEPVLIFARQRPIGRHEPDWRGHANQLIPEFEEFLFRRVLPAERVS